MAAQGLHCYTCELYLVAESRDYSLIIVHELLIVLAYFSMEHGLSSMWNLPRLGIEPVSPASAGVFLTIGSPGKSLVSPFVKKVALKVLDLCKYLDQCRIHDLRRREFSFGTRAKASDTQSFMWQKLYYSAKGTEKASDIGIRRGTESAPLTSLIKALYIFFSWLVTNREEPLEKGMAAHSSFLSWRIPMDRGTWGAKVHGVTVRHDRVTNNFTFHFGLPWWLR